MSFPVKRVFSSVKYVFIAFALSLFMVIISFYYSSISFDETDLLDIKIGSSLNEVITQIWSADKYPKKPDPEAIHCLCKDIP